MKTIPALRPAAAIRAAYQRKIDAMIDEMHASILFWVKAQWRKDTPGTVLLGEDASASAAMREALRKLSRRWSKKFDDLADQMADYFAQSVKKRCDTQLIAMLRDAGFTVKFKMTDAMRDAVGGIVGENVNLIRSIATHHMTQVETLVMQSVSAGRDLHLLSQGLQKQIGVTRRRAAFIARDQNSKATAALRAVREQELGITEGIWRHSGGGREPRKSHKDFSGTRFNLAQGHDFGDGFGPVRPGEAINCRCTWAAVLPFDL